MARQVFWAGIKYSWMVKPTESKKRIRYFEGPTAFGSFLPARPPEDSLDIPMSSSVSFSAEKTQIYQAPMPYSDKSCLKRSVHGHPHFISEIAHTHDILSVSYCRQEPSFFLATGVIRMPKLISPWSFSRRSDFVRFPAACTLLAYRFNVTLADICRLLGFSCF